MKVLAIIETNITDSTWVNEYIANVAPMLLRVGGKYITRTDKVELLEGDARPQFSLVVEFPSREVALNFYHSDEYKPYREMRQKGSQSKFLLVNMENGEG